eukprot:6469027-Amphidinium_carterae.1
MAIVIVSPIWAGLGSTLHAAALDAQNRVQPCSALNALCVRNLLSVWHLNQTVDNERSHETDTHG